MNWGTGSPGCFKQLMLRSFFVDIAACFTYQTNLVQGVQISAIAKEELSKS